MKVEDVDGNYIVMQTPSGYVVQGLVDGDYIAIQKPGGYVVKKLVHCRDCIHHGKDTCSAEAGIAFPPPNDWFCADGKEKTQ